MMCYVYVSTAKETKTSYINVNQINHVLEIPGRQFNWINSEFYNT